MQSQCEPGYKTAYGASLVCGSKSGASQCGTGRDQRLRTEYGLSYQCIEYVRRFLGQRYGGGSSAGVPCLGNGNAIDLWKTASPYFRNKYRNGEATTPPQPDDIVVFYAVAMGTADQIGHVAVVRKVASDRIWVAQQNVTGQAIDANYPLDVSTGNGGTVTLTDAGGALTGYAVAGWVNNPDNDPFSCASDQTCPDDYACVQGRCSACTAESNTAFCSRLGKTCGSTTAADNCGANRTVNCGTCSCPSDCSGHGTCSTSLGTCTCATGYALPSCGTCDTGYSGYPNCVQVVSCPSNCSGHGTCSAQTGTCSCATRYAGSACSACDTGYAGYPTCVPSTCSGDSSMACGKCGTQTRTCTAGTWSDWGTCSGEGACTPTTTQSCGSSGTQTCGNDCTWGACGGQSCSGTAPTQVCGKCGTQAKVCDGNTGQWGAWGPCSGEGVCVAGAVESCNSVAGIHSCSEVCTWGSCILTTCNGGNACASGLVCSPLVAGGSCYDAAWTKWYMPPDQGTYSYPTTDTVRDEVTELLWQRTVPTQSFVWADAKNYCATLTLNGIDSWRLPTVTELVSLVDYTKISPAIDAQAFPNTPSDWFWSSSAVSGSSSGAWVVGFSFGGTTLGGPTGYGVGSDHRAGGQYGRHARAQRPPVHHRHRHPLLRKPHHRQPPWTSVPPSPRLPPGGTDPPSPSSKP